MELGELEATKKWMCWLDIVRFKVGYDISKDWLSEEMSLKYISGGQYRIGCEEDLKRNEVMIFNRIC